MLQIEGFARQMLEYVVNNSLRRDRICSFADFMTVSHEIFEEAVRVSYREMSWYTMQEVERNVMSLVSQDFMC